MGIADERDSALPIAEGAATGRRPEGEEVAPRSEIIGARPPVREDLPAQQIGGVVAVADVEYLGQDALGARGAGCLKGPKVDPTPPADLCCDDRPRAVSTP